jgi:DNA invertase Pin-like site-specific DNA recombinase
MASKAKRVEAVAYMRTSSASNVGADKDSEKRQRQAIASFAKSNGYSIADGDWFYDPAVSSADPIETRAGFSALLDRIESNGVRVVIVEDASRFARQLVTQELGLTSLIRRGVRVLTASGEDLTDTSDPTREAMRQMAGVFAQLEKNRLVLKLRAARERKKALTGKCGGRRSHSEVAPALVALAKELAEPPAGYARGRSLREVAAELARRGHVNSNGKPFNPKSIASMLARE